MALSSERFGGVDRCSRFVVDAAAARILGCPRDQPVIVLRITHVLNGSARFPVAVMAGTAAWACHVERGGTSEPARSEERIGDPIRSRYPPRAANNILW